MVEIYGGITTPLSTIGRKITSNGYFVWIEPILPKAHSC